MRVMKSLARYVSSTSSYVFIYFLTYLQVCCKITTGNCQMTAIIQQIAAK